MKHKKIENLNAYSPWWLFISRRSLKFECDKKIIIPKTCSNFNKMKTFTYRNLAKSSTVDSPDSNVLVLVSKSEPASKSGCYPRISKTNKTFELRWNCEAIGSRTEPHKAKWRLEVLFKKFHPLFSTTSYLLNTIKPWPFLDKISKTFIRKVPLGTWTLKFWVSTGINF
jgi:hypothetical protein